MLGPKVTPLSAPGARDSSQAQSRLDEPGAAPQGPAGSAGGRSRRVRLDRSSRPGGVARGRRGPGAAWLRGSRRGTAAGARGRAVPGWSRPSQLPSSRSAGRCVSGQGAVPSHERPAALRPGGAPALGP
eukprot:2940671-Alexandrium_andersonii.AAC.1